MIVDFLFLLGYAKIRVVNDMKNYYLIVRYRDNNEVQVVELNSRWYLEGVDKDTFFRANSLEAIDLVTSRFKNREEMLKRMQENGYIRSAKADCYIASKRKKNGKSYVKTHEVIYNPKNDTRMMEFRDIAKFSLDNEIDIEQAKVKKVFDKLASKVFYSVDFQNYLKSGFTNIYKKIMELYIYAPNMTKPAYNVKYGNYWLLSSYSAVRNIIEALNRFDLFSDALDKVDANIAFLNENGVERKKVEKELLVKLDKNYVSGQYSLFDNNMFDSKEKKIEKPEEEIEILEEAEEESKEVSYEDKKVFIYDTLRDLPIEVFKTVEGKVKVNEELFQSYPSDKDYKIYQNLSGKVIRTLFLYTLHYNKYREALERFQNTFVLEEELREDRKELRKILDRENNVDKVYEWCNTYLKCLEFETINLELQEVGNGIEGENKVGSK